MEQAQPVLPILPPFGLPDDLSAQAVFDKVSTHLFTQGRPSIIQGECKYRSDNGKLACAVGCLIDDSDYDRNMESKSVSSHTVMEAIPQLKSHVFLLRDLQRVHDYWDNRDVVTGKFKLASIRKALDGVALEHKLSTDVLDSFKDTVN